MKWLESLRRVAICLTILVGFGLPSISFADILVSNLSRPYRASTPIGYPEFWGAQSFLYATPGPVQLDSIQAIVGNGAGSPDVVAELRTSVAGEVDNTPGGLVATFTSPGMSGASSVRTFTPNSAVMLQSGILYWFTLGSSNSGTFDWDYADDAITVGFGIMQNYSDSSDGGVTWILRDDVFPYFMQVNTTSAVPEPSVIGIALGLSGLALSIGRKRKR